MLAHQNRTTFTQKQLKSPFSALQGVYLEYRGQRRSLNLKSIQPLPSIFQVDWNIFESCHVGTQTRTDGLRWAWSQQKKYPELF